jgi:hypothetical protein
MIVKDAKATIELQVGNPEEMTQDKGLVQKVKGMGDVKFSMNTSMY